MTKRREFPVAVKKTVVKRANEFSCDAIDCASDAKCTAGRLFG